MILHAQHIRSRRLQILDDRRTCCAIHFPPIRIEHSDGNCFQHHMALRDVGPNESDNWVIYLQLIAIEFGKTYIFPLHFRQQKDPMLIQSIGMFSIVQFRSTRNRLDMNILAYGKTVAPHLKAQKYFAAVALAYFWHSLTFVFVWSTNWYATVNAPYKIRRTIVIAFVSIAIPTIFAYTNALEAFRIVGALIANPSFRYNYAGWSGQVGQFCGNAFWFFGHFRSLRGFCLLCRCSRVSLCGYVGVVWNAFANKTVAAEAISTPATVTAKLIIAVGVLVADICVAAFIDVNAHLWCFTFEQRESISTFTLQT